MKQETDSALKTRWQSLMQVLQLPAYADVCSDLMARYSEKQRHYHTAVHLLDCLQQLDLLRADAQNAPAVELALWFHDAIYQPYAKGNEEKSAALALAFMQEAKLSEALQNTVHDLIMATLHTAVPHSRDAQILVDCDLAILGSSATRYAEFEKEVRQEYSLVPFFLYRSKRKEILQSFLQREHIYSTVQFRQLYETQARQNLAQAIAALS